jgi:hypothetical protein
MSEQHFTDPKSGVAAFSVVVGRVNSWQSRVTRAQVHPPRRPCVVAPTAVVASARSMAAIGWIATSRSPIDRERLLDGSVTA